MNRPGPRPAAPARRAVAALVLAAVSLMLLGWLSGVPRLEYRVGLMLWDGAHVGQQRPLTGEALQRAWQRGLAPDTVAAALQRAGLTDWTPAQVAVAVHPELRDSDGMTFLVCDSPRRSCRDVVVALAEEWVAAYPPWSTHFDAEDPEHATTPRSPVLAAALLAGAGGLVAWVLLAAGLLARRGDAPWRLGAGAFVTVASMRQGAFDGVLPNAAWQAVVLGCYLVLGIAAAWSWRATGRARLTRPRALLLAGLGALALTALASTVVSPQPRWTLVQAGILTVALAVVAATALGRWGDAATRDGDVDSLVLAFAALLGWGLLARGLGATWPGNPTADRFQSFLFNPNVAGLLAATFGCVAAGRVLAGGRGAGRWSAHRVAMAAAGVVLALTVVLSGSRGALLALLAGLVVVGWCWGRWRAALGLAGAGVTGGLVLVALTRGREGGLSRLGSVLADAGRFDLWRQAVERWAAHPILGNGYRSGTDESVAKTLHNAYLTVLAELGLVGTLALLVVVVAVVAGAVRTRRPWAAAGAVALGVAEVFDSTMVGFLGPVALPGWLLLAAVAWGGAPVSPPAGSRLTTATTPED